MDLELIPLKIELHVQLIFEISFNLWGKKIGIKKVIFKKRVWHYQTKAINLNIFQIGDIEKDPSPPMFSFYSKAVSRVLDKYKYVC